MAALTGQKIHEYGDLTFALFSPARVNTPHRCVATLTLHNSGNPGWCETAASPTSIPWRSSTQWRFWAKSRCEICETEFGCSHLPQTHWTGGNVVVSLCLPSGEANHSSLDWKWKGVGAQMIVEIKPWTENPPNATEIMASSTFVRGTEMRLQLDVAKSVRLNKKNCNNAPTHSQISTKGIPQHAVYPALPSWEQGGGITTTAGGGNSHISSGWKRLHWISAMVTINCFKRANFVTTKWTHTLGPVWRK